MDQGNEMQNVECRLTLAMIKPDAVERRLTGEILSRLEAAGFSVRGLRMMRLSRTEAEQFYSAHRGRDFFDGLVAYTSSGPVVGVALEGDDAVARLREIIGATDPADAAEGTIRRVYGETVRRNSVHGSDSPESAWGEIRFFFPGFPALSLSERLDVVRDLLASPPALAPEEAEARGLLEAAQRPRRSRRHTPAE
jgi:nucleoside-diphosphate kinase